MQLIGNVTGFQHLGIPTPEVDVRFPLRREADPGFILSLILQVFAMKLDPRYQSGVHGYMTIP